MDTIKLGHSERILQKQIRKYCGNKIPVVVLIRLSEEDILNWRAIEKVNSRSTKKQNEPRARRSMKATTSQENPVETKATPKKDNLEGQMDTQKGPPRALPPRRQSMFVSKLRRQSTITQEVRILRRKSVREEQPTPTPNKFPPRRPSINVRRTGPGECASVLLAPGTSFQEPHIVFRSPRTPDPPPRRRLSLIRNGKRPYQHR